jgi:hypothetical protein
MNEAVNRFIQEMGAIYAAEGDRDTSPILFKADDMNSGTVFELSLPKGEGHSFWRVRERELTPDEVAALTQEKKNRAYMPWIIGSTMPDEDYRVRGYVYNARCRNKWNVSVDKVV